MNISGFQDSGFRVLCIPSDKMLIGCVWERKIKTFVVRKGENTEIDEDNSRKRIDV